MYHELPTISSSQLKSSRFAKVFKLHSGKQLIEVVLDKDKRSKSLYLDRALQFSDTAEHMYHEMMAHVPLLTTNEPPRDVLIVGGGDGGVSLRVLMHPSVRKVVQVELDEKVVFASKQHFPLLGRVFDDPRLDLRIEDAIAWVMREAVGRENGFDACIIDSTDEPLVSLWSKDFYGALRRMIRPGGVLMQNVQSLDVPAQMERILRLQQQGGFERIRPVFIGSNDYESPYVAFLASGLETVCPGPVADALERVKPLKASWYSPSMHRAALVAPVGMVRRWHEFGMTAVGCREFFRPDVGATNAPAVETVVEERVVPDEAETDFDVVVVGGGLAGAATTHVLTRNLGVKRVLLLEAKDVFGGRIETTTAADFGGTVANVGANWIHFASRNPVLRLAERLGCQTATSANGNMRYFAEGLGQLPASALDDARDFAATLSERMSRRPAGLCVPASKYLEDLAGDMAKAPNATALAARHLHFFGDVIQDHTAMPGAVSGLMLCAGTCGGDTQSQDRHMAGEAGTMCLHQGLLAEAPAGSVDARTGHVVTEIRAIDRDGASASSELLDSGRVVLEVAFKKRGSGAVGDGGEPQRVRAKAAVLAVPMGILQHSVIAFSGSEARVAKRAKVPEALGNEGLIRFNPSLPDEWVEKWMNAGLGQSLRTALHFDRVFWDRDVEFFAYLFDAQVDVDGMRPSGGFFYGEAPAVEFTSVWKSLQRPILLAEVGTHLANRLQNWSDVEVGSFLTDKALKRMFPEADVPQPMAVKVKRYSNDPYLRQALSYPSVARECELVEKEKAGEGDLLSADVEGEIRRWTSLWRPLWSGKLAFAGEHTSARMGTIDGAVFSGIQAAWNIACAVSGGAMPITPLELIRAIGIFGDWFPPRSTVKRCIEAFATKGWGGDYAQGGRFGLPGGRSQGRGHAKVGGPCASPLWLDALEVECRFHPPEPPGPPVRHCLDQGD